MGESDSSSGASRHMRIIWLLSSSVSFFKTNPPARGDRVSVLHAIASAFYTRSRQRSTHVFILGSDGRSLSLEAMRQIHQHVRRAGILGPQNMRRAGILGPQKSASGGHSWAAKRQAPRVPCHEPQIPKPTCLVCGRPQKSASGGHSWAAKKCVGRVFLGRQAPSAKGPFP